MLSQVLIQCSQPKAVEPCEGFFNKSVQRCSHSSYCWRINDCELKVQRYTDVDTAHPSALRPVRWSAGLKREWPNEGVVVTSAPTLIINYRYHRASLFLSGLDGIPAVRWSLTDQMLTAGATLMLFVCMFNGSINTKHKLLWSITGKINKFYVKMRPGKRWRKAFLWTSGCDLYFLELLLETIVLLITPLPLLKSYFLLVYFMVSPEHTRELTGACVWLIDVACCVPVNWEKLM